MGLSIVDSWEGEVARGLDGMEWMGGLLIQKWESKREGEREGNRHGMGFL
jgi:hypothetical protein